MKGDKYPIDETFTRFFECIIKNILRISAQNGTLINDIRNLLAVCIIPTWDQLYELLSLNIEWKMDYYIDFDTFGNQQLREYGYITDWITPTLNYMNEINIYQYDSDKDTSLQLGVSTPLLPFVPCVSDPPPKMTSSARQAGMDSYSGWLPAQIGVTYFYQRRRLFQILSDK